jgi:hypothetical protein
MNSGDGRAEGWSEYPRLRQVEAFPVEIEGQQLLCLRDPLHVSDSVLSMGMQAAAILGLLDGRHSLLDIQAAHMRRFGSLLFREPLLPPESALCRPPG